MAFEVAIFGNFPDIPELKLSLPLSIWTAACDILRRSTSCRVTVLVLFVSVKPEARREFWIELAVPYTLANHNKINSDDTLPFIIFFKTSFSRWLKSPLASPLKCCYQPCSQWRHKKVFDVIQPLAGGLCYIIIAQSFRYWNYMYNVLVSFIQSRHSYRDNKI